MKRTTLAVLGLSLIFVGNCFAAFPQGIRPKRWDLRAGYSYQYRNHSRPTKFQLITALPSAVIPITETIGPAWFRGKLNWNPELHLAAFIRPYHRALVGATPIQFQWGWETPCRWKPYLFAGAGILHANVNRRETRNDLNFNLQGGIGAYFDFKKDTSLIMEYRHTHISNAGLHEDNAGINTHGFLVGFSVKR